MVVEIEELGLGKVREMGIPVKLRLTPGEIKGRSPKLGEHTEEILTNLLGYSADEIASFKDREIL